MLHMRITTRQPRSWHRLQGHFLDGFLGTEHTRKTSPWNSISAALAYAHAKYPLKRLNKHAGGALSATVSEPLNKAAT